MSSLKEYWERTKKLRNEINQQQGTQAPSPGELQPMSHVSAVVHSSPVPSTATRPQSRRDAWDPRFRPLPIVVEETLSQVSAEKHKPLSFQKTHASSLSPSPPSDFLSTENINQTLFNETSRHDKHKEEEKQNVSTSMFHDNIQNQFNVDKLLLTRSVHVTDDDPGKLTTPHLHSSGANLDADAVTPFVLKFDRYGNLLASGDNGGRNGTATDAALMKPLPPFLCVTVPDRIARYLRPYQVEGVRFLLQNYAMGRGCLLADDMGLGKTLQAIAFVSAVLHRTRTDYCKGDDDVFNKEKCTAKDQQNSFDGTVPSCCQWGSTSCDLGSPILIVCPSSLVDNWREEFRKWSDIWVLHMKGSSIHENIRQITTHPNRAAFGVVIVTDDALRNCIVDIATIPWHVVIFDEVHRFKNPRALKSVAANKLASQIRIGLSGTPMPNDYDELYSIIDLLLPGYLGDRSEFDNLYSKRIKKAQTKSAREDCIESGKQALSDLRTKLQGVMLRRRKEDTLSNVLPKKTDYIVFCQLSPLQQRAYQRVLNLPDVTELLLKAYLPCPCGSGAKRSQCGNENCPFKAWRLTASQGSLLYDHYHFCTCSNAFDETSNPHGCRNHRPRGCYTKSARICPACIIMPLIMLLRKVSLHLDLLKADPSDAKKRPERYGWHLQVASVIFGEDAVQLGGLELNENYFEMMDFRSKCGKLAALVDLLERWAEGGYAGGRAYKVLIFSNSIRMLRILEKIGQDKGWATFILTGATPTYERQHLVHSFNQNAAFSVFLSSPQTGGLGLNLTGANKVVIVDPSYSPAADLQAMDRAFRLGQDRNVSVYRLIAAGTIEERIYMRQISKQQHSNLVVDGVENQKRLFDGTKKPASVRGGAHEYEKGELWGLNNLLGILLQEEVEQRKRVYTMERVKEVDSTSGLYRVEEMPADVICKLEMELEKVKKKKKNGDGEEEDEEEEEEGYDALLAAEIFHDNDDDYDVVQNLPGVLGTMLHAHTVSPIPAAVPCSVGALAEIDSKRNQPLVVEGHQHAPRGTTLECLAAWQAIPVRDMAIRLMQASEGERWALRRAYAKAVEGMDAVSAAILPTSH